MNNLQTAEAILAAIGGRDNLRAATHCATRLRLVLVDEGRVDENALTNIPAVKGTFSQGGQFQVILGTGVVNNVYGELVKVAGVSEVSTAEAKELGAEKMHPLQQAVKTLSDIFVPIIPAIVAGGLLMGINNVLVAQGLFFPGKSLIEVYPQYTDLSQVINMFANAPFVFLPVLIAFSATRIFGGNPYLGAALGMIMVHPELLNAYGYNDAVLNNNVPTWNLLGTTVEKVGYQGTVLPILVLSWILATLEKNIRRVMPTALDLLLTPLFALFITAILTFTLVGPLTREAGDLISLGLQGLYNATGPLGAGIFGLFYAPIVITGMHHSFVAIETQLLADMARTGGSFIFPIAAMSNMAQGGAALGAFFVMRDQKLKSVASAGGISAVLGITEPAMFGVNLKLRYPFYAAMIGAAVASAFITIFGTKAVALGAAGIPGIISIQPQKIIYYIIGMAISFGVAMLGTIMLSKSKFNPERETEVVSAPTPAPVAAAPVTEPTLTPAAEGKLSGWVSPLAGEVVPLSEVPDQVFASGAMGSGFAIRPDMSSAHVVAPLAGEITALLPTAHAFGLRSDSGLEFLVHVGVDTVALGGAGFSALVSQGQRVEAGQPVLRVNWSEVEGKVPSVLTPVLLTDAQGGGELVLRDGRPALE